MCKVTSLSLETPQYTSSYNTKGTIMNRLIVALGLLLTFTCLVDCKAGDKVTAEDYRNYFSNLNFTEQQSVISKSVSEMQQSFPVTLNEYLEWSGIIYFSKLNIIQKVFTLNIDYEAIDQSLIDLFSKENRINSVNSICTGNLYKTWMFESGVTIRNSFKVSTGQNLTQYDIDKDDCLGAGYTYP